MVRERIRGKLLLAVIALVLVLVVVNVVLGIGGLSGSHSEDNAAASLSAEPEEETSAETAETDETGETSADASEAEPEITFTVCVDAGHGGKDDGCSSGDRVEKDDNLEIALALRDSLEERKLNVLMTRDTDVYVDLYERCDMANKANVDCFISLHRNAAGGLGYGIEIWKSINADDTETLLADTISAAMEEVGVQRNRGIFVGSANNSELDDVVLREPTMPSVIVETGFVDNDTDNTYFDEHMEEYADAIADSILEVFADQIYGTEEEVPEGDTSN